MACGTSLGRTPTRRLSWMNGHFRRLGMFNRHYEFGIFVCFAAACGCNQQQASLSTPTGVTMALGQGTIAVAQWKDGPTVMVCTDIIRGDTSSTGTFTTSPTPIAKQFVSQTTKDGRKFVWEMESDE